MVKLLRHTKITTMFDNVRYLNFVKVVETILFAHSNMTTGLESPHCVIRGAGTTAVHTCGQAVQHADRSWKLPKLLWEGDP